MINDLTIDLAARGGKALVPFFTAGYPDEETFRELVKTADAAGADVIEIGVPFSDPIADGPLIQEASERALQNGISLDRCLKLASELSKEISTPLLFMSYYNPILRLGIDQFAKRAADAGVAGVILPDVSFEESKPARSALRNRGLEYIDLVAPTSSDDRIEAIADTASGFLYLVSITGVTGDRSPVAKDVGEFAARVRTRSKLPLYVGFGISSADDARATVEHCDGVIIGSALIRMIKQGGASVVDPVQDFLREVKEAISARAGLV